MFTLLTDKQIEVLDLRAKGYENKEIATQLGLSVTAIQERLKLACKNLNAKTVTNAAAMFAVYNTISSKPQLEWSDKQACIRYFKQVTQSLEIKIFRDALCAEISGHTNFETLAGAEWEEFLERYSLFIHKIQTFKKHNQ